VEEKNYEFFRQALARLDAAGVLGELVLVGSWCLLVYENHFRKEDYRAAVRTRDLDFAVPEPRRARPTVDLGALFSELGFVQELHGPEGYTRFVHPDLFVEFLGPERGRGGDAALPVQGLGVRAQPLRFMDYLNADRMWGTYAGIRVHVPHPVHFALHKLLIAPRRRGPERVAKAARDREQALMLLQVLYKTGQQEPVRESLAGMPPKWQRAVRESLALVDPNFVL
jgi:hypothetical protein